jgi:hypothetical protein
VQLQGWDVDRRVRARNADVLCADDIRVRVALGHPSRGEVPLWRDRGSGRRVDEVVVAQKGGVGRLPGDGGFGPEIESRVGDVAESDRPVVARDVKQVSDSARGPMTLISAWELLRARLLTRRRWRWRCTCSFGTQLQARGTRAQRLGPSCP